VNINEDTIKGKWLEIKGDLQKTWGKLTDDELEKTKGEMKSISGLVRQRYGDAKENYEDKVSAVFNKYADSAANQRDKAVDAAKSTIKGL
jgi:uncharacterized protein YjbJ (UPF0337 family)